jgi:hypothetical protein
MSGSEATCEIQKIENSECLSHTPVIGLSGDENITESNFDTIITKPLELQKFYQIIEKYCDLTKIE